MSNAILRARFVGRALRFALAFAIFAYVYAGVGIPGTEFMLAVAIPFIGLIVLYSLVHFLVANYIRSLNKWLGAVLALMPVILVAVLGDTAAVIAVYLYIGVSLFIVAARSDGGCEVMAIPSLIFGRYTHLVCIVFSPIDWIEEKIASRLAKA